MCSFLPLFDIKCRHEISLLLQLWCTTVWWLEGKKNSVLLRWRLCWLRSKAGTEFEYSDDDACTIKLAGRWSGKHRWTALLGRRVNAVSWKPKESNGQAWGTGKKSISKTDLRNCARSRTLPPKKVYLQFVFSVQTYWWGFKHFQWWESNEKNVLCFAKTERERKKIVLHVNKVGIMQVEFVTFRFGWNECNRLLAGYENSVESFCICAGWIMKYRSSLNFANSIYRKKKKFLFSRKQNLIVC